MLITVIVSWGVVNCRSLYLSSVTVLQMGLEYSRVCCARGEQELGKAEFRAEVFSLT